VKRKTAYKLGIEALERWKREYIWDANMLRKRNVDSVSTRRADKKVIRIEKAIEILRQDLEKI
jgi:hypothetical protein